MQSVPDPLEEASKGIAAQKSDNQDKESRA
jgi:hypothetical protein